MRKRRQQFTDALRWMAAPPLLAALALVAIAWQVNAAEPDAPPEEQQAEGGILLNFKDAPLSAVLERLSEAAGLAVVEDVTVEGRITVTSRQPLNVAEAVALLNSVLTEKGYAAVRQGRILKIVTLEDAKQMRVPVRSGADPDAIEPTDEIITQVIPLRYADAAQVKEDLAALIPAYADLSANAGSNALIMTDTSANVRRIAEIVSALDRQMAGVAEVRVFALQYADAADAAKLINEIFQEEKPPANGQRGPASYWRQMMRGGAGRQEEPEQPTSRAPRLIASSDERSNSVVVSGPSEVLPVVEGVIKELDANPVEEESVLVYHLKNSSADTLAELLNNLFGQQQTQAPRAGASSAPSRGDFFRRLVQGAQSTQSKTTGALSGQVYCVAHEDTNTLLALTAPSNFERLRAIIQSLDSPIPQVLIKVLIAEVTWDKNIDLGMEFSILNMEDDGDQTSVFTDFGVADKSDGLVLKMVGGDVSAALRALQKVGKTDVLSRPHILTSDNQTATITVGEEVPFIRNTRVTETGQTINTIEYEDIGIILEVTPHINPDGLVIMDVSPEISSTTAETVPISETVDAPVFAKRSASTRIAIQDNQTIVIGGLMQDGKTETVRKVPLLGDVPLLGALFRRKVRDTRKTELLIFLTPHVAREATELIRISKQEVDAVGPMKEAVRPGEFERHLESMRSDAPEGAGKTQ
ncbi:MAG: type II secretion system secretin GspD [Planctomycetes bacterium]|nr:type II secretion system secretin GspD [Planctomycetota bacterium]